MIEPLLRDDAFLADVSARAERGDDHFDLWWLGQSGYLLQWKQHRLLLDPYLSDSLTEKYATTDKPHVRMTARVIAPERLSGIEAVTASHVHTDHLDPQTLQPLVSMNPGLQMVCPEATRGPARDRSGLADSAVIGLDALTPDTEVKSGVPTRGRVGPFQFEAVPAAHEQLDRDHAGHLIALGFVIRFGRWAVYHSGDTVLYPGMEERLQRERVDLALLPINGRRPERRVSGNLWGREAASLAHSIGARCVIPGHYELFEFNTESPAEFVETCHALGQHHCVLRAGERWSSELLPASNLGTAVPAPTKRS